MGGIEHVARSIGAVLHERLPWQRKTQRENLALLVATMLSERSANLMALAAALTCPPRSVPPEVRVRRHFGGGWDGSEAPQAGGDRCQAAAA